MGSGSAYRNRPSILVVLGLLVLATLGAVAPAAGQEKVLNIGLYIEPPSLDPHNTELGTLIRELANIYEPLIDVREKIGVYEPVLATSWTVSDDGLAYTFKLRRGVKFADGTDFNAEAVRANYDRVMNVKRGPYAAVKQIKAVEVVDDGTVRLVVHKPSAAFLSTLRLFMMVSPATLRAHAGSDFGQSWFNERTAGTGPFTVDRWQRGSVVSLVRNPHHWRGFRPDHFDRVNMRVILEADSQRLLIEQGQIDIAQIISIDALPALKRNPRLQVIETEYAGQMYLVLNTALPPLNDPKVRKALAHAWNHDKYKALRKGIAPRADGPAPNAMLGDGYTLAHAYPFDLERARKLLAEAGVKPGTTLTALVQKGDEQKRMLTEVFRDELAGVGVKLDFVEATWPAIFKRATDWSATKDPGLDWHVVAFYKSPDLWTPWTFLYRMFHSETQLGKPTGQWNFAAYANPAVDRLLDEANLTMDQGKAMGLWRRANEMIYADVPVIPVEKMVEIAVLRSDIRGYKYHAYDNGRKLYLYELSRAR
jgi:peptide/nickel transport system substrate-binding protein